MMRGGLLNKKLAMHDWFLQVTEVASLGCPICSNHTMASHWYILISGVTVFCLAPLVLSKTVSNEKHFSIPRMIASSVPVCGRTPVVFYCRPWAR